MTTHISMTAVIRELMAPIKEYTAVKTTQQVAIIKYNNIFPIVKRKLLSYGLPNMIIDIIYSHIDIYEIVRHTYCREIKMFCTIYEIQNIEYERQIMPREWE